MVHKTTLCQAGSLNLKNPCSTSIFNFCCKSLNHKGGSVLSFGNRWGSPIGKIHETPIQLVSGLWDLSCHQTLALSGKCLGSFFLNTAFVPNFVLHRKINLYTIYYELEGTFLVHKTLFCQAENLYLKNPGSETIFNFWITFDLTEFLEPSKKCLYWFCLARNLHRPSEKILYVFEGLL